MGIPVPTLSDLGWVTNPTVKMDKLLSHLFEADVIQSYTFKGSVSSIQGIIAQYGHDINALVAQLRSKLEKYLQAYYDVATVELTANTNPSENPTDKITLVMYATVVEDGQQYSVGKLLGQVDGSFKVIRNLLANGDPNGNA